MQSEVDHFIQTRREGSSTSIYQIYPIIHAHLHLHLSVTPIFLHGHVMRSLPSGAVNDHLHQWPTFRMTDCSRYQQH